MKKLKSEIIGSLGYYSQNSVLKVSLSYILSNICLHTFKWYTEGKGKDWNRIDDWRKKTRKQINEESWKLKKIRNSSKQIWTHTSKKVEKLVKEQKMNSYLCQVQLISSGFWLNQDSVSHRHLFAIANASYTKMMDAKHNQVIIIR